MHEVTHFGAIVLLVSATFAVAVLANKLSERLRVPAAAFFLLAAALASDLWPGLGEALSIRDVERIAVVALVVILLDRKSTRLNSSHVKMSYAVFCFKKKKRKRQEDVLDPRERRQAAQTAEDELR